MLTATKSEAPAGPSRGLNYRPQLDGVRAIAVYLVVAYHAGLDWFTGGFVGVDVFFVLSGYLVTQLLLAERARGGHIGVRRFYARRYRRLLPAAFVCLVVTAVAYVVVASAAEVFDAVGAFRASFLYVANWYFISQAADYFASDINRSPVIHFWSLAVEEQFYLVWPALLAALFAVTRRFRDRRMMVVRIAVALAGLLSLVAALHISSYDLNRAYYGTDTRGYQLLAGALLALCPLVFTWAKQVPRLMGVAALISLVAIVALATSALHLETIQRGIATTAATCMLIVAIESVWSAGVTRGLSGPGITYLGRLSYGTYLWHWPVIIVLTSEVTLGSGAVFAVACVMATALAALSFHALELRVRYSRLLDRRPTQVIGCGLALSLLGGLVLAPAILNRKNAATLTVTGATGVDIHTLDWRAAKDDVPPLPDCSLQNVASCTIVHGSGQHVVLLGDSNARMYIPTFEAIAQRENLTLSVVAAPLCPWQHGLYFAKGIDDCDKKQKEWYGGILDALDPAVIVAVDRPIDDPANPAAIFGAKGLQYPESAGFEDTLRDMSRATIAEFRGDGRKVVIIEPIPIATIEADPLNCLSSASSVDDCIYQASTTPSPLEQVYRDAETPGAVWSLDLDRLVCPRLPACDPVVDGLIVKRDSDHITGAFAASLADRVDALLREDGVLP